MKAHLSRRYRFSASHRLHSDAYSDSENRSVYGKCNNPHGHGHNYILQVTVSGEVDAVTGMVVALADLDERVNSLVIEPFDRSNLNFHQDFVNQVPTTENLCTTFYRLLAGQFGGAQLERIRVEETGNNSFEYAGKGQRGSDDDR